MEKNLTYKKDSNPMNSGNLSPTLSPPALLYYFHASSLSFSQFDYLEVNLERVSFK
jgi:hypothetical protein